MIGVLKKIKKVHDFTAHTRTFNHLKSIALYFSWWVKHLLRYKFLPAIENKITIFIVD